MNKYNVSLTSKAVQDISDIYEYIYHQIGMPQTALEQIDRIEEGIASLSTMPYRIKLMSNSYSQLHQLRQLLVDRYSVIFTIRDKDVYVVRVLYSSCDLNTRLED